MSAFKHIDYYSEHFGSRLPASVLRVKANRWIAPELVEENGGLLTFSAIKVSSRFGTRALRREIKNDPNSQLALPSELQGTYYKSAVGLLLLNDEVNPVRLETLNTEGDTGLPMIQHALIDIRENPAGQVEKVRFR